MRAGWNVHLRSSSCPRKTRLIENIRHQIIYRKWLDWIFALDLSLCCARRDGCWFGGGDTAISHLLAGLYIIKEDTEDSVSSSIECVNSKRRRRHRESFCVAPRCKGWTAFERRERIFICLSKYWFENSQIVQCIEWLYEIKIIRYYSRYMQQAF